jgi:hypothetical protein
MHFSNRLPDNHKNKKNYAKAFFEGFPPSSKSWLLIRESRGCGLVERGFRPYFFFKVQRRRDLKTPDEAVSGLPPIEHSGSSKLRIFWSIIDGDWRRHLSGPA